MTCSVRQSESSEPSKRCPCRLSLPRVPSRDTTLLMDIPTCGSRDRKGHLHARRFTTSEDDLEVTHLPLARASSISRPPPLRTRRASITQSDAKLYAMAQVREQRSACPSLP